MLCGSKGPCPFISERVKESALFLEANKEMTIVVSESPKERTSPWGMLVF